MPKPLNIVEGESVEEFDALCASFHAEHQPSTETERILVEQMIHHEWLMRRALRMRESLMASVATEADVDPKRLNLVVRYYRTHSRAAEQAKRQLDSMRKHRGRMEKLAVSQAATDSALSRRQQRQWEQLLKKMPPLSNWVN